MSGGGKRDYILLKYCQIEGKGALERGSTKKNMMNSAILCKQGEHDPQDLGVNSGHRTQSGTGSEGKGEGVLLASNRFSAHLLQGWGRITISKTKDVGPWGKKKTSTFNKEYDDRKV